MFIIEIDDIAKCSSARFGQKPGFACLTGTLYNEWQPPRFRLPRGQVLQEANPSGIFSKSLRYRSSFSRSVLSISRMRRNARIVSTISPGTTGCTRYPSAPPVSPSTRSLGVTYVAERWTTRRDAVSRFNLICLQIEKTTDVRQVHVKEDEIGMPGCCHRDGIGAIRRFDFNCHEYVCRTFSDVFVIIFL